jgi:hypothetical protein
MTTLKKWNETCRKFGATYLSPGNPKMAWRGIQYGVVPYTNFEMLGILTGKIESQKNAVRPSTGLIEKYGKALVVALAADQSAQALNPDFDPKRTETFPEKFWAYFNALK